MLGPETKLTDQSASDRAVRQTAIATIWMAAFTLLLSISSAATVWILKNQLQEMHEGGTDTRNLAAAAGNQATWTKNLATSAGTQSTDTHELVSQAKTQADRTKELADRMNASVSQTSRLAKATEVANVNVMEADRPWVGGTLSVDGFVASKTPTYTITFINSGKRPARVTLTQSLAIAQDFKDSPQYKPYDTTPSVSLIVPNQAFASSFKDDELSPISAELMQKFNDGSIPFRIYARVEYIDLRTNSSHWTHLCWRYTPKQLINGGFSNCTEYNDAT